MVRGGVAYNLLNNEEILNTISILVILSLCLPFVGFNRVISPALAAQEYAYVSVFAQFFALLSNIVFLYFLIPQFGVLGGGYSLLISRFFAYLVFLFFLWRLLNFSFLNVFMYRGSDYRALKRSTTVLFRKLRRHRL